jgi:hypothetical protein
VKVTKVQEMNELKNKYLSLYDSDGISKEQLDWIEHELQIRLPNDFREITGYYGGGSIGYKDIHAFSVSCPDNLVSETLKIRSAVKMPNRFIVIGEQSESIIIMDTENKPSILHIDSVEISKLEKQDFISEPDVWMNFSDFFAELLDEEIEERSYCQYVGKR